MASNTVSFLLPISYDTQVTGNHNATVREGMILLQTESAAGSVSRFDEFGSEFDLPIILPDDVTLIDFAFNISGGPLQNDSGYSFVAVFENYEYGESQTAHLVDRINNYKNQYNSWPTLKIKIGSWVYVTAEKGASFWINIYAPKVICSSEGREEQIRPVSDIVNGHLNANPPPPELNIPVITDVYKMLNEIEADDDITQIRSLTDGVARTSIVALTPLSRPSLIQQIRLRSRIKTDSASGSDTMVEFTVIAGSPGATIGTYYAKQASYTSETKDHSWHVGIYYDYYKVITNEEEFVVMVNDYIRTYHKFPSFDIKISTTGANNSGKGTEAESCVSQVYLDLVLDKNLGLGIYDKTGGKHRPVTVAFKKVDGTWSEITEEETKNILKNNTIRRG